MGMDAGGMDRRIRIERSAEGDDGYNTTEVWETLVEVWASYRPSAGREAREALGREATLPATFRMRWSRVTAGLTAADRLYEIINGARFGPVFDIKSPPVEIGRREGIEIVALAGDGA